MIINFSVENFLSFKSKKVFDLTASEIKEYPNNYVPYQDEGFNVLKTGIIYGANASGKSNLLKSMAFLCDFILLGWKSMDKEDEIPRTPYLLDASMDNKPSKMSISLIGKDNSIYEYSIVFNKEQVINEKFSKIINDEFQIIFEKANESFKLNPSYIKTTNLDKIEEIIISILRKNSLAISTLHATGADILDIDNFINEIRNIKFLNIPSFFRENRLFSYRRANIRMSAREIKLKKDENDTKYLSKINSIIRASDVGLVKVDVEEREHERYGELVGRRTDLISYHNVIDGKTKKLEKFDFEEFESTGTQNLLGITPSIINVIEEGNVLIYDELDASLHPLLTQMIVDLVHNNSKPNAGQLIFTAHDISLIDNQAELFRRDQIYFCEKIHGETDLYSLYDFRTVSDKKIRSDENYAKNYINGKYKAVPLIKDITANYDICDEEKLNE